MDIIEIILHTFFEKCLWKAVFPTSLVLLVFAFFNLKAFKKNRREFIFILVGLIVLLAIRLIWSVGYTIKRDYEFYSPIRRFYDFAILSIPVAVAGFPVLINFSKRILLIFISDKKVKTVHIIIFWIIICSALCISQTVPGGLSTQYLSLYNLKETIKNDLPSNKKSLFIYGFAKAKGSQYYRMQYFADADKSVNMKSILNIKKPEYFYEGLSKLGKMGYQPYIFEDNRENKFKKIFTDRNLRFKFKLLKEWGNGKYSLLKYIE
ncbi:MAG: hypothetical protein K9M56_02870 [Victivallales bacterium]|nr:hypothetical protein [Victivallales bacterium]